MLGTVMVTQGFTKQGQGPHGVLAGRISDKTKQHNSNSKTGVLICTTYQLLWHKYSAVDNYKLSVV